MMPEQPIPVTTMSAGMYALAGLKVWDLEFADRTPYRIVAAVIAGKPTTEADRAWVERTAQTIDRAIELLGVSSGTLCGARQALKAVAMLLADEINEQLVYNVVTKAQSFARPSGVA